MRWRSLLFVPAIRPELVTKAVRSGADAVVIDLEDAVPPSEKAAARDKARAAAGHLNDEIAVCIRVNAPTSEWFADDVESLPDGISAVVVPKWERSLDLPHPIVAGLETVRGVADAREQLAPPAVACYFGAEDYIADLGGVRTPSNSEVHHARATVAVSARLAGIDAVDMVTLDFSDDDRFLAEAVEARALGYAGKLCIHPKQVALANESFVPSADEVGRARRLLAAYNAAGGQPISFEGQMIDEVVARLARATLARAYPNPD